jgi:hypothetical protein
MFLIAVRLKDGCFLQIRAWEMQKIRELFRAVTSALRHLVTDPILSLNCCPLSSSDGRGLRQAGIGEGIVIECAWAMRGGMQGTAESTTVTRRTKERVMQCTSKVKTLKTMVDQAIRGIPIIGGAINASYKAGAVSCGRVEAAQLDLEKKVWGDGGSDTGKDACFCPDICRKGAAEPST